ncbi:MAG: HAMP domain-containing histidine kinase [Oscillospiraceae bacterium]|jgi:signal transduction histidine kinase|nr:HAMP domain-containing histidine kinase [Oscillospiraceae bacterium]
MKITIRLWILISAVAVFILALIWLFMITLLPEIYSSEAYSALDSHADYILQMWEQIGEGGDLVIFDDYVQSNSLHVDVRTRDGDIVYDGGWALEADVLTPQEVERAAQGEYITKSYVRNGVGPTILVAKTVYVPPEPMVVLVCAPVAPVEDLQELVRQYMLAISVLSLSAALGIGFLTSRMFVKPIKSAEQAAQRIALGDYSQRMNSRDGSELGDLARAIDNMADQLGQLEAMRQNFIATVSHQFKTPLSIIQGHAELIQDSLPEGSAGALKGSFEIISDEVTRLDRMSRDILKLSELQSGIIPLAKTEIPLHAFCRDIIHSLEILAPQVNFFLRVPGSLNVLADAQNLEHVLRNILQNALVHAEPNNITVCAVPEGAARVRVSVRDDGRGMEKEQAENIWTRFYKGNQKDRSGSGLGMAIAAAVLENHESSYGVITHPGQGTEIWFTLDVAAAG